MRSFSRLKQRRSVDFPHPDGPIRAVTLFLGIFIEMFSSACLLLYQRFRPFVEIMVLPVAGTGIGSDIVSVTGSESVSDMLTPYFFLEMGSYQNGN